MTAGERVAVVGVDLEPTGDDAIMESLRLLRAGALASIHLLYVIDPKDVVDDGDMRAFAAEAESLRLAPNLLESRARDLARLAGLDVPLERVRGHGRIGEPAATLLQMCVDYDADLLVVGTHGRRGLDRWFLGSVAEEMTRKAPCLVLVARPKDYFGLSKTQLPDPPYADGMAPAPLLENDVHTQAPTTLDSWEPSDNGPTGFRIV